MEAIGHWRNKCSRQPGVARDSAARARCPARACAQQAGRWMAKAKRFTSKEQAAVNGGRRVEGVVGCGQRALPRRGLCGPAAANDCSISFRSVVLLNGINANKPLKPHVEAASLVLASPTQSGVVFALHRSTNSRASTFGITQRNNAGACAEPTLTRSKTDAKLCCG